MRDTKRARTFSALKHLALTRCGGISRSEAAQVLDIDLRTAASYLEELASGMLLKSEVISCGGKGRPHTVYRSNADNLSFMGLQIQSDFCVTAVLVDSVGRILAEENRRLPENASRFSLFSSILELVSKYKKHENKVLYGIGLAISRWLQPPLAGIDVYANLAEYLERESNVAVHRDVNINCVAFAAAKSMNCRNLAVVHPGKVMEFGLVIDGEPDLDFARREAWLSHLCVKSDGRRCYCGKYGCLENYVTSGSREERLKKSGNPATVRALGEMLGVAMVRLAKKFPVEKIVMFGAGELFPASEEYFSQRVNGSCSYCLYHGQSHVAYGAALESLHFELYRFTETLF